MTLPEHIAGWNLPSGWCWGQEGLLGEHRHYQELVDALGRSLSLVTAPDPAHAHWLYAEARALGHRTHPSIPTTFHYWTGEPATGRGPGYLRRWITGEPVVERVNRQGPAEIQFVLQVMRSACSAVSSLHDSGTIHGALAPETVWTTPTGRFWLLDWQWAVPRADIPQGVTPSFGAEFAPPEWQLCGWSPTVQSDQWQLAAICFYALTGEEPPSKDIPPVKWLRPECPESAATALDRALLPDPDERFPSVSAFLRAADRGFASTKTLLLAPAPASVVRMSDEERLRWAVGDDYEVLALLGRGTFGTVWRARDLSLEREVALKVLHPNIARDGDAVGSFWREAKLAAQLAHPAIVPIYDWDSRGDLSWYTMELAEGGSLASLVARAGARPLSEVAPQIEHVLEGLSAAHANGIIHRDLKPENILIDRYRRWRITDFGIANVTGEARGGGTGTPAFAAPEQLLGEPQGPAADLFSAATIVAFALAGRPPFGGDDAPVPAILAAQLGERLDYSVFPPAIADWLRTGLSPDPERRFESADDMLRSWRDAVHRSGAADFLRRWWRLFSLGER
jgi:serine/threonine-protein kinase